MCDFFFFYHVSFALSDALRNITTGSGRKRHKSSGGRRDWREGKKKKILKNLWLAGMTAGAQVFNGSGDKEPPFGAQGGVLWEADYRHQ